MSSLSASLAGPNLLYKAGITAGQQSRVAPRQSSRFGRPVIKHLGGGATTRRHRRSTLQTSSALPVTELALAPVFPAVLSVAFRAVSAGFLLYTTLQWASARNSRVQVQRNIEDHEQRKSEQKRKLDRLRGITDKEEGKQ